MISPKTRQITSSRLARYHIPLRKYFTVMSPGYNSLISMVFCSSISTTTRPSFSSCFITSEKRLKPIARSLKSG